MADEYAFPAPNTHRVLRGLHSRLDGMVKSTGRAKYNSDLNLPGMLHAKVLTCPYAHARITKLDTTIAAALPGVVAIQVIQPVGSEVLWAGDDLVAVAAETEDQARDAVRAIVLAYEELPHFQDDADLDAALASSPDAKPGGESDQGDVDAAFAAAATTVELQLGMPQIAHIPLEPHGQVCVFDRTSGELTVYASTQAVSTLAADFARGLAEHGLEIPAAKIRILCEYMGGGFGAKFSADKWGVACALLAHRTGRPVKLFIERDHEISSGGSRPSAYGRLRIAADAAGRLTAWQAETWGSGGIEGTGAVPTPYVFTGIPNIRKRHTSIATHRQPARSWRAPNHPQACFFTMAALDDLADALGKDPYDLVQDNLDLANPALVATWRQQLAIANEKFGWKERWRARHIMDEGPIQRGVGLSLHTWGGRGHRSNCEVTVHPDGAIEASCATQDLGTGTRTVIAAVLAETFGRRLDQVTVHLGDSRLPQSGASGGSSTVGGVAGSTRRAAQDVLRELLTHVAPALAVAPEELEVFEGGIRVAAERSRALRWTEACAKLEESISVIGRNPGPGQLNDSGVGGVQMAEVTVDTATGVVRMQRLLAVQDCGLIVNKKLAVSQMHGGMIMGIGSALYEELTYDRESGRVQNADMAGYHLPRFSEVGVLEVHMLDTPEQQARGVIGLGEPPVVSPGAAISNAVANAIGVRVPQLPITPARVLAALGART
jgi:xanthine dehydrogenase YagR molybdenum-binding subunit